MIFANKRFQFIALLFTLSIFNTTAETNIKVSIDDLRSNKGHVLLSLFNNSYGFPDNPYKAIRKVKLEIINKSASVSLSGLPPGKYAIAILHDENDDQKMNKNFFGIPKEGYGFSNNVMGTFGPPSFSKASFSFTGISETKISIEVRYGW